MPFVVTRIDGKSQPRLVCDSCRKPIDEMEGAIATYLAQGDDDGNLPVYFFHKGACDPARNEQRGSSEQWENWMEFNQYLPCLLWNHGWGSRVEGEQMDTVTLDVPQDIG